MSASISDPFLLSSYAAPSTSSQSSQQRHAVASQEHTSASDGFVTVAVQRDGVHVLDTSTLHSAISYTLGPSTTFSSPPVSRTTRVDGVQTCRTYAVVETDNSKVRRRTVCTWEEHLSGGVMSGSASAERKSTVFPHAVSRIHLPAALPDRVLLVHENGSVSITDAQLNVQRSVEPVCNAEEVLLQHMVLPRSSCTFLPRSEISSQGAVVVYLRKAQTLLASVVIINNEDDARTLGSSPISLDDSEILDASCSSSGFFTLLTSSGVWHAFQLDFDGTSLSLSPPLTSLQLKDLTFAPSQKSSQIHRSEVGIAALGSAHVLLVGITAGSSPELVLLLWDLRYGVLLASQTCPVPSSLDRTKTDGCGLALVAHEYASQAVMVLTPHTAASHGDKRLRSTILMVSLACPRESTLAHAVGRAAAGARWIEQDVQKLNLRTQSAQAKMLRLLRVEMSASKPQSADALFFNWLGKAGEHAALDHVFVKQVLDVVFRNERPKATGAISYSPKILRHLLDRRVVNSGMVDGGLLPTLFIRQDWSSCFTAVNSITDIPEADLISLLGKVVTHHRQTQLTADDAMQVDAAAPPPSDFPLLADFLARCVTYPASPGALRVALHAHLSDVQDMLPIIAQLDSWIEHNHTQDSSVFDLAPVQNRSQPPADFPPLDKVLVFTEALLDVSFLTLIAHPPAHTVLQTLAMHLGPAIALRDTMAQLCGPLQPFAAAHARAAAAQGAPKADARVDWRRRKRAIHERAELALGLYQVEELVL